MSSSEPTSQRPSPKRRFGYASCATRDFTGWGLTSAQLSDLELLLAGAFAPLNGFMTAADVESCRRQMRLADGTLWPVPIVLAIPEAIASTVSPTERLVLRDAEGVAVGLVDIDDVWPMDTPEGRQWFLGGPVEALQPIAHHDFVELRLGPEAVRREIARRGWRSVAAYQPHGVVHRPTFESTRCVLDQFTGGVLLQPIIDPGSPGDLNRFAEIRCHRALAARHEAIVSLLPLARREDPGRDWLLRATVARNYGCSCVLVDPDDSWPGRQELASRADSTGAWRLLVDYARALALDVIVLPRMFYRPERKLFVPEDQARPTDLPPLSSSEVNGLLARGAELPDWFAFPEVAAELGRQHPPRSRKGFTVFFTGLSGSGKSTIANILRVKLQERDGRRVTVLDGDLVRRHLSSELGFSREHRDLNIRRIGFVAAEITGNGGVAICAPIAPYDTVRREVRRTIEATGGFVLVFVDTPLEVCEERDRKGLYTKARAGLIGSFTGVSDPFEPPSDAEVVVRTTDMSAEAAADAILRHLEREGYLPTSDPARTA